MVRRSTAPPRPPAAPPADVAEGAALVRDFAVKLYDRANGQGVDRRVTAGILFRAAFDELDALPADQRKPLADRVHQRSYEALTDESAASNTDASGGVSGPSNTAVLKSPAPKPPR